jgi:hypothetical protein
MRQAIPLLRAAHPDENFDGIDAAVFTDYVDDELSDFEADSDTEEECH